MALLVSVAQGHSMGPKAKLELVPHLGHPERMAYALSISDPPDI